MISVGWISNPSVSRFHSDGLEFNLQNRQRQHGKSGQLPPIRIDIQKINDLSISQVPTGPPEGRIAVHISNGCISTRGQQHLNDFRGRICGRSM